MSGRVDAGLLEYKKSGEYNGYQTKVISGEVVFTAKNSLGVNLGGAEYQKRIKGSLGYTKKINSNKISGIEIVNPNVKNEIVYQKMSGISGAIADGNYKIIGSKQIINDKGLSESISCKQMKIITSNNKNINSPELNIGNNGQVQSYKKQVVITSKTENTNQRELNGSPSSNAIFNSKTVISGNMNIKKRGSQNSGNRSNNSRIKDSPNSGNNIKINDSANSLNQMKKNIVISQNTQNVEGQNKTITTTRQYQMKIKANGDKNEKVITETKKTTEVKMKKK